MIARHIAVLIVPMLVATGLRAQAVPMLRLPAAIEEFSESVSDATQFVAVGADLVGAVTVAA